LERGGKGTGSEWFQGRREQGWGRKEKEDGKGGKRREKQKDRIPHWNDESRIFVRGIIHCSYESDVSPSGSYTILFFSTPNVMAVFRRNPLTGASRLESRWYEKTRFSTKISLYLQNDAR